MCGTSLTGEVRQKAPRGHQLLDVMLSIAWEAISSCAWVRAASALKPIKATTTRSTLKSNRIRNVVSKFCLLGYQQFI